MLIFLDADGPLLPFRDRFTSPTPLLRRLDPADGPRLLALPGRLVWATTWGRTANEVLAPLLGLPALPVVDWPESTPSGAVHWKTTGLISWASGEPFVWIDDEIGEADRSLVADFYPARAMLHRVDPFTGLTSSDFDEIGRWLGC